MSIPRRPRLPERSSIEQLRKQAKEHLDTARRRSIGEAGGGAARARARVRFRELAEAGTPR